MMTIYNHEDDAQHWHNAASSWMGPTKRILALARLTTVVARLLDVVAVNEIVIISVVVNVLGVAFFTTKDSSPSLFSTTLFSGFHLYPYCYPCLFIVVVVLFFFPTKRILATDVVMFTSFFLMLLLSIAPCYFCSIF